MLIISIVLIIGYILYSFLKDYKQDEVDLAHQSLSEKFKFTVAVLNKHVYAGQGVTTYLDLRSFNLYKPGSNQIIIFEYNTGSLNIVWKYKYLQKEVVHSKTFDNVRNLSLMAQERMAYIIIQEMTPIIAKHQIDVLTEFS